MHHINYALHNFVNNSQTTVTNYDLNLIIFQICGAFKWICNQVEMVDKNSEG